MTTLIVTDACMYADTLITYKGKVQGAGEKILKTPYGIVGVTGDLSVLRALYTALSTEPLEDLESIMRVALKNSPDTTVVVLTDKWVIEYYYDVQLRAYAPPLPAFYGSGGREAKAIWLYDPNVLEDPTQLFNAVSKVDLCTGYAFRKVTVASLPETKHSERL